MIKLKDLITEKDKIIRNYNANYPTDLPATWSLARRIENHSYLLDDDDTGYGTKKFKPETRWAIYEHNAHKTLLAGFLWNLTADEDERKEDIEDDEEEDNLEQYFRILDLKATDSPEEIKTKYRYLIKFYHPDHYQGKAEKLAYAEKKTKELNNAFEKLHEHGFV